MLWFTFTGIDSRGRKMPHGDWFTELSRLAQSLPTLSTGQNSASQMYFGSASEVAFPVGWTEGQHQELNTTDTLILGAKVLMVLMFSLGMSEHWTGKLGSWGSGHIWGLSCGKRKEKQCGCLPACHCHSSILQHSLRLCWPLPAHIHPLLLGYPLLTLCTGTGQLHPVLSAGKPWANLDWKVCAKIKAGHKHLSDSTSTSVYLKPKASGVQSMMNYFFVSGLTAHVTSAANPSSI